MAKPEELNTPEAGAGETPESAAVTEQLSKIAKQAELDQWAEGVLAGERKSGKWNETWEKLVEERDSLEKQGKTEEATATDEKVNALYRADQKTKATKRERSMKDAKKRYPNL